ncbi:hypothetical protein PVAP13_3NG076949 [Panicum virgatum]|uniref:Uncharacterized protein n=1 Tax=Panicum virgatum TaxID=38727 RepID=A0A8T0UG29_PANVG|nr:hypothetical protein PVAP13_3NG076949 [Panicum virgatum]
MCSLAPPTAPGFHAAAPAGCGVMAREPARRVRAEAPSARAQNLKRARDGSDGKTGAGEGFFAAGVPAPGQQRLQERMRAELDAVRALHRKAVLLCRGDGRSGAARFSAAIPRRDAAAAAKGDAWFSAAVGPRREAAAKRSETCPSKPGATEAAHHQKEPAVKQQQAPVPHAAAPPSAAKEDARKRRRVDDEIARAREECRQQVLEAERTALPDETVYPHELAELGIAFEYAVTRTRSQALAQDLSAATR